MELTPTLRAEVFPQSDGGHRVYLRGELDLLSRGELLDTLDALLILDLADLSFVDASGIGTILEVRQRTEQRGALVVATGASGIVRRVFEILDLTHVFACQPGESALRR